MLHSAQSVQPQSTDVAESSVQVVLSDVHVATKEAQKSWDGVLATTARFDHSSSTDVRYTRRPLNPWIMSAVICVGFIVGAIVAAFVLPVGRDRADLPTPAAQIAVAEEIASVTLQERQSFTANRSNIESLCFSPDNTKIATAGYQPRVWDVPTGQLLLAAGPEIQSIRHTVFSADSSLLATTAERKLQLWSIESGEVIQQRTFDTKLRSIAGSRDGLMFAVAAERKIDVIDSQTLESRIELSMHDGSIPNDVAFLPDNAHVVAHFTGNRVVVFDIETGHRRFAPIDHPAQILRLSVSPDGEMVAVASFAGSIDCYDTQMGKPIRSFRGHTDRVRSVCFSADGRLLASVSDDETLKLWNVASGDTLKSIARPESGNYQVAISPDGTVLAATGKYTKLTLWDLRTQ